VRNFYVPAGNAFTAENVPAGTYVLRVALGKDWNDSEKRFNYRKSFEETEPFDLTEAKVEGGIEFSRMTITLHKVVNGNFHSHPISEDQFWR